MRVQPEQTDKETDQSQSTTLPPAEIMGNTFPAQISTNGIPVNFPVDSGLGNPNTQKTVKNVLFSETQINGGAFSNISIGGGTHDDPKTPTQNIMFDRCTTTGVTFHSISIGGGHPPHPQRLKKVADKLVETRSADQQMKQ